MSHDVIIRAERPEDRESIHRVHVAAFPTPGEANLVDALRAAGKAIVSLVAETAEGIVGHILFSPVKVVLSSEYSSTIVSDEEPGRRTERIAELEGLRAEIVNQVTILDEESGLGLAPVAVHPSCQRQGIGARLIQDGLVICREKSAGFVVVLGEPEYYSRFGFETASLRQLRNEYGVDEPFMVVELQPEGIPGNGGLVRYAEEFSQL